MNLPNVLGGSGAPTNWLNGLRAFAASCRLLPGRGYKLKIGPNGTALEIDATQSGSAPFSLSVCSFVSIPSASALDYYVARPLLAGGTYGANVNVARAQDLWGSKTTETIADGTIITFQNPSLYLAGTAYTIQRTAVDASGLYQSDQYIRPFYNPGELILVARVVNTGVASAPNYIEVSNRIWAS